jgi:DHA2 family multidrug resistance protein
MALGVIITITAVLCALLEIVDVTIVNVALNEGIIN